jgi:methylmalonyl-CoA/ethylmalonyl-CoA epimerase
MGPLDAGPEMTRGHRELAGQLPMGLGPLRVHHIGVAVSSLEDAVPAYRAIFGYELLSGPFEDALQRVSVCFLGSGRPGEPAIELVAPAAERSPIGAVLARGVGAYHVCYEVPDVEAALAHARAHRCVIVSQPVPAVAFGGRRIAWFYMPTRQLVELLESP